MLLSCEMTQNTVCLWLQNPKIDFNFVYPLYAVAICKYIRILRKIVYASKDIKISTLPPVLPGYLSISYDYRISCNKGPQSLFNLKDLGCGT